MADNLGVVSGKNFTISDDEGDDKQFRARQHVVLYYNDHVHDRFGPLSFKDTYVVLFSYALGHWKAHVSTTIADGRYYEVTYNSATGETYIDEYQKVNHICIDEED